MDYNTYQYQKNRVNLSDVTTKNVEQSKIQSLNEEDINIFSIEGTNNSEINTDNYVSTENISSLLDKEEQDAIIEDFENQIAEIEADFEKTKNEKGWISGLWDGFKNLTGIGAGSNKTQKQIDDMKKAISDYKNGKIDISEAYKLLTDNDLTYEELEKYSKGEVKSKAADSVDKYQKGQKMCVDTAGDIISGIASVSAVALGTALGICAAPFTAGASMGLAAASLGIGAAVGTVVKVGIKASDCIGNDRKYGLVDFGYDFVTGAINGAMGPVTSALGGAAGTAVMKKCGMEALETVVKSSILTGTKSIIEEGAEAAGKQIFKRVIASVVDMAVDGSLSGATDAFSRALAEGRTKDILKDTTTGFIGGLIMSPIIGGGFKAAGKIGAKVGGTEIAQAAGNAMRKISGGISDVINDVLPDSLTKTLREIGEGINSKAMANAIKKSLSSNADGTYNVKIGKYTVLLAGEEVTEDMLNDTSRKQVYEYALKILNSAVGEEAAQSALIASADEAGQALSGNAYNEIDIKTGDVPDISKISDMSLEEKSLLLKKFKSFENLSDNELVSYVKGNKLNDEQIYRAIKYLDENVTPIEFNLALNAKSDDEMELALNILRTEYENWPIYDIEASNHALKKAQRQLGTYEYPSWLDLCNKGLDYTTAKKFEGYPPERLDRINELLDLGFPAEELEKVSGYSQSQYLYAIGRHKRKLELSNINLPGLYPSNPQYKQSLNTNLIIGSDESSYQATIQKLKQIADLLEFDNSILGGVPKELPNVDDELKERIIEHLKKFNIDCSSDDSIENIAYKWLQKYVSGGYVGSYTDSELASILIAYSSKQYVSTGCEPMARWMEIPNIDDFIKNFPDVGEIYSVDKIQSFAKTMSGAEQSFGNQFFDGNPDKNVKLVVFPKNQLTSAYDVGNGKYGSDEVLYQAGQKFKVLYKDVENISGIDQYVIYMQEV